MKRGLLALVVCAVIACVAELFVFNLPHWDSMLQGGAFAPRVECETGITEKGGVYKVESAEGGVLELTDIGRPVGYLFMDVRDVADGTLNISIEAKDAAHGNYYWLGSDVVRPDIEESKYIRLHLSGDVQALRVRVDEAPGSSLTIDSIQLNAVKPFSLSKTRLLFIWFILFAVWCLRPSSRVHDIEFGWARRACSIAMVLLVVVEMFAFYQVNQLTNPQAYATVSTYEANDQYNDLADAFIGGSVVLDKEPPAFLAELSNPYDCTLRDAYLEETNQVGFADSYTDYCYYNGKFYSYFGPLPAVMLFVPFKVLTGFDLPTWVAVLLFGLVFCAALPFLLHGIARKVMDVPVSLGNMLLMDVSLCFGCGFLYLEYMPTVYSVPISSAIALVVVGLALWAWSKRGGGPNKLLLALGSLCIALTVECRPHFVLAALLAIPMFWNELVDRRLFFSRKGIANTVVVLIPFVVVAAAAMWYNAARFGSPFDFGANYNLTGNDMTRRGFDAGRFPMGLFAYFFQPIPMTTEYPYLVAVPMGHDYLGHVSMEPMFGGFLAYNPIALAALALFTRHVGEVSGPTRMLAIALVLLGVVLVLVDIQASGQTARYMADFSLFILMAAAMACFHLANILNGLHARNGIWWFNAVMLTAVFVGVALNFWCLLIEGRYADLAGSNPQAFYMLEEWLSFLA